MKSHIKKIAAVFILAIVGTIPAPAYSVWGVGDIALDPIQDASGIAQTVLQIEQVINQVQMVLKAFGLDVVIYKVSQKLSQKLLTKVLNKANGGGDGAGSRLFVDNFGKYFEDIANQQIGIFTNNLSNSSSPFAQAITVGISDQVSGLSKTTIDSFSLGDVLPDGVKWQDAANDISTAGSKGWDFYGKLALPQNTPLGSSILAQDELAKSIKSAQNVAKTELTSTGFLPDKGKSGINEILSGVGGESFSNANPDGEIKTPAKTNEDQAGQSVTETFERLRNADTFGKILFNTIQQMIEGLVSQGFSKLSSDGGAAARPYGGPRDLAVAMNSGASWASAPEQLVDLRNELASSIQKTELEIDYISKTIDKIRTPLNERVVLDLEYCVPGPDSRWEERLKEYQEASTKDTSERAAQDGDKGSNNAKALTIVRRQTQQAILEARALITNPFLNIPAATEMNSVLREYYRLAGRFKSFFDNVIVKRQVLTNLQTIRAEAAALGRSINDDKDLVLYTDVWKKKTQQEKNALYASITPDLKNYFPEYLDPQNPTELKPLPTAAPDADREMMNRVINHQWDKWEKLVADKDKQRLYAKYISMSRDISDSSSVERSRVTLDAAQTLNEELTNVLTDCYKIRGYVTQPGANANDTAFINTLTSARIAQAFSGPSILNAAEYNTDFDALNERLVQEEASLPGINGTTWSGAYGKRIRDVKPSNKFQVPDLAKTPAEILLQDSKEDLFCRLTLYHLYYWAPSPTGASLTGEPIGCGPIKPDWVDNKTFLENLTSGILDTADIFVPGNLLQLKKERYEIPAILADGGRAQGKKRVTANWYHTNNAEILFRVTGND